MTLPWERHTPSQRRCLGIGGMELLDSANVVETGMAVFFLPFEEAECQGGLKTELSLEQILAVLLCHLCGVLPHPDQLQSTAQSVGQTSCSTGRAGTVLWAPRGPL